MPRIKRKDQTLVHYSEQAILLFTKMVQDDNKFTGDSRISAPTPPTPLARRLVRYILGFGVGIGVGLSPYLGIINVPLFKSLYTLIPETMQNQIIPLSATLMGTIAVVIQWYAGENLTRSHLRSLFRKTLWITSVAFAGLLVIHTMTVVTVPILAGQDRVSFVVGYSRPIKPPCTAEVSDAECIRKITFDPSAIESFWGDRQIRVARLLLTLAYLTLTGSFGSLVGLLLLRERLAELEQTH